jgi:hypothetical protein
MFPPNQQQQSQNVPDKQTPDINQQQQYQKSDFNSRSENVVNSQDAGSSDNKGTDSSKVVEAEACNSAKIAGPSFNGHDVEDGAKPLVDCDEVSQEDKQNRREAATELGYSDAGDDSRVAMR